MPVTDPVKIWDAVAVTGTNAYASRITHPSGHGIWMAYAKTGDAVGVVKWQVNNLEESTYLAGVSAAAGATQLEKEAANTVGWQDVDLQPTATIAIPTTNPSSADVLLTFVAGKRSRFVYTNASGTGTINGRVTVLL